MEELEFFKKKIISYIDKVLDGGVVLLPFLDEAKVSIIEEVINKNHINAYKHGGIINSDRVRYILSPYEVLESDFKIIVYKINYNKKFISINHRHVLGNLMALGIKRECIGDIVFNDNLDIFFACTKEISSFIKEGFKSLNQASIELEEIDYKVENIIKYDEKLCFLASLRLDVIISSAYSFSRSAALEYIKNGLVYINHINVLNPSHAVKELDEISVRHKGRVKVISTGGETKSGRLKVILGKRI